MAVKRMPEQPTNEQGYDQCTGCSMGLDADAVSVALLHESLTPGLMTMSRFCQHCHDEYLYSDYLCDECGTIYHGNKNHPHCTWCDGEGHEIP
jgi:hypothetical protein